MPTISPLQVPEQLLQTYLGGTKSRELYEITYISSVRPDPRDMAEILLVQVTVRMWATDARNATDQLALNPQYAAVNRDQHALTVLSVVSIAPVAGGSGGGVPEDSMLVTEADRERALFSQN